MVEQRDMQLKKTAKHSVIYAFGTMLRRITGLVMLPIYTRYLTPEDYGVVELLTMAIEIVSILIGMRISQAMFRFYIMEDEPREKQAIVSTVLFTVLLTSCVGAGFLYISAEHLSKLIFGNMTYIFEFQIFAFTLITNAIIAVGLSFIRAIRKPILFVSIGAATLFVQVLLNIVFVVVLEMHVTGVVISSLLSGIIVASGLMIYVLLSVGVNYSTKVARELIHYVSPLIVASLGAFYVSYADKYFLRLFGSLTEVGLYALAARFASIVSTVNMSFNMSWMADRFEVVKKDNAREIYSQVFRFLSGLLVVVGSGLAIFANDFFYVMTDPAFYSAANVVPFFVLVAIMQSYTTFCNFGILLNKRTHYIAKISWYKAIIATIGYVTLIPILGLYGAVFTLLISSVLELYWVNKRATSLYDMRLNWGASAAMLLVASVVVAVTYILPSEEIYSFFVKITTFLMLLVGMYYLPIWQEEDKKILRSMFHKILEWVK